jgi:RNA recognition motif-containing protein
VFLAIRTKSYRPDYVPPVPRPSENRLYNSLKAAPFNPPTGPSFNPPAGPSANLNGKHNGIPGLGQIQSRKRTFDDRETDKIPHAQTFSGLDDRSAKQARYSNRSGGPGHTSRNYDPPAFNGYAQANGAPAPMAPTQQLPSTIPGFDPNNPMSAILAMQALLPLMGFQLPNQGTTVGQGNGRRCYDYDSKGFCARGSACPYEHGTDSIVVPTMRGKEPTPFSPILPSPFSQESFSMFNEADMPSFTAPPRNLHPVRRRANRAPFSMSGRNFNRSITTIVVENIPEEYFSEEQVNEYFTEFGSISEITMQPYKRLALVKYEDWDSANKAYQSPKTIFDNRFVKVFWYDPDQKPSPSPRTRRIKNAPRRSTRSPGASSSTSYRPPEAPVDLAELERKVAEAQKLHEEKLKKQNLAATERAEVERKLQEQVAARKLLLDAIVAKERERNGGVSETEERLKEQALREEALKANLARLEAEAESLGIDPNDAYSAMNAGEQHLTSSWRGRGRGGWRGRGRGSYTPRGRGPYRGWGYAPRGAYTSGAVMRLDNRPKKVAVLGVTAGNPQDEELRQFLFVSDYSCIYMLRIALTLYSKILTLIVWRSFLIRRKATLRSSPLRSVIWPKWYARTGSSELCSANRFTVH